ncbi:MAG: TIGR00730 family Rossman fold protein [Chloroflexota bacterium]|nr:MAG: TIGR00730 family Rossman fold protein [Chloroflexota bacterium]
MDNATLNTVCIYCGSSDRVNPEYLSAAKEMGEAVARRGLRLVYGAGSTGLMGALADGALQEGGEVIGVIPVMFNTPQLAHAKLTQLEVVETIHLRKARMVELADAFIALPGGFGTFEELFEILTWAQVGLHRKPIGLLNTRGYFTPLLSLVSYAHSEGFIYDEHLALLTHAESPQSLLDKLDNHQYPHGLEHWLLRDR